ncbi:MAG: LacI family DNA-binding transcriptional regulator [Mycobacteriales bacterium]
MVTLADVARLSATSRSTASRALRGDPRISAATTQRVRFVAESLAYQPNLAARSLATGRSGILGLIVPTGQLTGEPYGAQLVGAVTTAAAANDYAVMLWLSHQQPSGAVQEALHNGIVDGLVISIIAQEDPWVNALLDGPLPTSLVGRHALRDDLSYATVDNTTSTRALMEHVLDQGYQRIGTIRGPHGNADAEERHSVFVEAIGGAEALDANLVETGAFNYESGYACARSLLRHEPDCIVAANDQTAIGAIDAIHDAGLSVPRDVAVTGWDDLLTVRRPTNGLTTVHHDIESVGREATSILMQLIGGAKGPIQRTLPASLVIRGSTPRIRSVAAAAGR